MLERDYLWLPSPGGSLSYPRTVLKVHVVIGMLHKSFLKTQFKERGGQEPHRKKKKQFKMSHSEIQRLELITVNMRTSMWVTGKEPDITVWALRTYRKEYHSEPIQSAWCPREQVGLFPSLSSLLSQQLTAGQSHCASVRSDLPPGRMGGFLSSHHVAQHPDVLMLMVFIPYSQVVFPRDTHMDRYSIGGKVPQGTQEVLVLTRSLRKGL